MSIALDYTSPIDPAALKAAGVVAVQRYLSWLYRWGGVTHTYVNPKIIQGPEYAALRRAGIEVTLNWEYDARDWLGGATAGSAHAAEAVRQAQALGYPAGCAIIGSADFDMTSAQWSDAGHAYAQAFAAGIRAGGYRPGAYGPYDVLTWVRDARLMDVFWQAGMSTSWSGGRNAQAWPGAHLRQRGYKTVAGQQTDWNDILIPEWGQAGGDMALTTDERALLDEAVNRLRWIDPRVRALMDMSPTYADPGNKLWPAGLVTAVQAIAAKVDVSPDELQAIQQAAQAGAAAALTEQATALEKALTDALTAALPDVEDGHIRDLIRQVFAAAFPATA